MTDGGGSLSDTDRLPRNTLYRREELLSQHDSLARLRVAQQRSSLQPKRWTVDECAQACTDPARVFTMVSTSQFDQFTHWVGEAETLQLLAYPTRDIARDRLLHGCGARPWGPCRATICNRWEARKAQSVSTCVRVQAPETWN